MTSTIEADVRIDDGPVVKGELRIDREIWDWSVTVRTYVPISEPVSVRMVTPAGEFFGVAIPTSITASSEGATTKLAGYGDLGRRSHPPKCTCPLIDTSVPGGPPSFSLGDPTGCKVHGQERDAEIEAAKRQARGEG